MPEPDGTFLKLYLPLAHKHERGLTTAAGFYASGLPDSRSLMTPQWSTFQSIARRFGSSTTGTRGKGLADAAAILYKHLSGDPLSEGQLTSDVPQHG